MDTIFRMEKYKKKSLGFSKGVENRDLRAYRRSVDRKNAKYLRLSALRRIDENKNESVDICTERYETETANSGKEKQIRKVSPELSRLEMLRKWKEEKLLKKKLEAKKKPFVVSHVSYKPTPTFSSPMKSHGRKTKDNSRLQSSQAGSVACRTALQKLGNPQNNTIPVKTQLPASFSHSRLPKAVVNSKHLHLAYSSHVFLPSSAKQEVHGKETSKPNNSRKNNAFSNHSVSNALPIKSLARSQQKTACSFKASSVLSGSQPCDKSKSKTVGIQNSSALPKVSNKTASSNTSAPKGSGKQHKQTQSFAPANFLFKAPLNVEKFIFPNGISSRLVKEDSDKSKEHNKIHEMDNKEDLSSCALRESNTEDNSRSLKTTLMDKSIITETTDSTAKVSSTNNSCVVLDIAETTKSEKAPNEVQVARIEETNKKLFCKHDENVQKATNYEENKSSNEVEESEKNKENSMSLALTNGDNMSKNDLETVGDSCRSQKFETVDENLDICEELLYDGKYPSMPQSHNTATPRRSRRLASLHQKLGSITKDNSITLNQSVIPTHTELTEKLSILSTNGAGRHSQDESEIKAKLLPTINEYEESVCSEKLAKPRRERLCRSNKKDEQPNSFVGFHSDCVPYLVGTPTRPITRLQQRKISLLGSPQMSTSLPGKSIKGDLITFSPS